MNRIVQVGSDDIGPLYLIKGSEKTALIDTGISFWADAFIENLEKELQDRPLDYILITHSHWDHIGGIAPLRERWPNVIVTGHKIAQKVLQKESAWNTIQKLSKDYANTIDPEKTVKEYNIENYRIDQTIKEGDQIDLGDLTVEVYETPGHTRCSVSFHIHPINLIVLAETVGIPYADPIVFPCYLTSSKKAEEAVLRMQHIKADYLLPSHSYIMDDDRKNVFFEEARAAIIKSRQLVAAMKKLGYEKEQILDVFCNVYNDSLHGTKEKRQSLKSFKINARCSVDAVWKEIEEEKYKYTDQKSMRSMIEDAINEICKQDEKALNYELEPEIKNVNYKKKTVELKYPLKRWQHNPSHVLHGGITGTLFDVTMGILTFASVEASFTPTIHLEVDYIKPVPMEEAVVYVCAQMIEITDKIVSVTAEMRLESNDLLVAKARAKYYRVKEG